jgi:iron complex outermembrane receptor protein
MKKNHAILLLNVSFLLHKRNSGVVKTIRETALPGVNIVEKGTNNGVSTDIDAYKNKKRKELQSF